MLSWPAEHPACADPALAPWRREAGQLCPDGTVIQVLRYLPGRRLVALVQTRRGFVVLKMFARPRGRGNHRRLSALAGTAAAAVLPTPIATSRDGHSCTLTFQLGTPMPQLPDDEFVAASADAGSALRQLHSCGATLDRTWTIDDELRQLANTAGTTTRPIIDRAIAECRVVATEHLVPSHRDFYPAQVVRGLGRARIIDLDDAAKAPAALDVANFIAHLDRDRVVADRTPEVIAAAQTAFLGGYGDKPDDLSAWRELSLARLVALAESRHHDLYAARLLETLMEHA